MTVPQLGLDPEGSQRKMCPKHGVAHGVCVDPIKPEIPPDRQPPPEKEPEVEAPRSDEGCASRVAPLHHGARESSDLQLADPPPSLAKAMRCPYHHTHCQCALCVACGCDHHVLPDLVEPNRFDPYQALDKLEDILSVFYDDQERSLTEMEILVPLLRAYITGREA